MDQHNFEMLKKLKVDFNKVIDQGLVLCKGDFGGKACKLIHERHQGFIDRQLKLNDRFIKSKIVQLERSYSLLVHCGCGDEADAYRILRYVFVLLYLYICLLSS